MTADRHNLTRRAVLGAGATASVFIATGAGAPAAIAGSADSGASLPPIPQASSISPVRFDFVCETCGSDTVTRDAWAEWDIETQQWALGTAFDYAYCHHCQEETRLEEIEFAPHSDQAAKSGF